MTDIAEVAEEPLAGWALEADDLSDRELRELEQIEEFLNLTMEGEGPINAGIMVGWSPARTQRKLRNDTQFAELVALAEQRVLESIETVVIKLAKAGNMKAIQMVLYNRRSDRWRDVRHLEVRRHDEIEATVVLSVGEAMRQRLAEGNVAELQPGGPMDAIDVASEETDVGSPSDD